MKHRPVPAARIAAFSIAAILWVAPLAAGGADEQRECEPCSTGATSISSNFNGQSIAKGSTIWFSAIFKPGNRHAEAEYRFDDASIWFRAGSTVYTHAVPSSVVRLSAAATSASTQYDPIQEVWLTVVPLGFDKPVFLTGLAFHVTTALPGGIQPVIWSGNLSANKPDLSIQWQWSAAVYTSFAWNHSGVHVKPVNGNALNPFANSDGAGTPENYKAYVTGGARGGGGSNYTGSLSSTATAVACFTDGCPTSRR